MSEYLAENLRYLIWVTKQKGTKKEKTYSEYIEEISDRCKIDSDRFRLLLSDSATANGNEIESIKLVFMSFDEERIPYIADEHLFRNAIEKNSETLILENLIYLLHSIPWGNNQSFIEDLNIQASTLTRWKTGKMKPSRYYKEKICRYFGISSVESLKYSFLFLGLSPVTTLEKKLHLKRLIDKVDKQQLDLMYPAIVRLLDRGTKK